MRVWKGLNGKTPAVVLTFDTVELADKFQNDNLISVTGHKIGNRPKARPNQIFLSGQGALKVLFILREDASMFKDWKLRSSVWHYDVSDQEILNDALKFTTRSEWNKNGRYYQVCSKHRKSLFEKAVSHMSPPIDPLAQFQVYVYEFSDHSCYVGLTCAPAQRHRAHLEQGPVFEKISTGIVYELKVLARGVSPRDASSLEIKEIEFRKSSGWLVHNRHKGGSLGQLRLKYSYAEILAVAKACLSRKDFCTRYAGMYQFVGKRRWNGRLGLDVGWPRHAGHRWTFELCLDEARKFEWRVDWITKSPSSYVAARKRGWLKKIKEIVGFKQKPSVETSCMKC